MLVGQNICDQIMVDQNISDQNISCQNNKWSETKSIRESMRLDGDLKQVACDLKLQLLFRMIKQFLSIAWIYFDSAKANGECIKWSFLMLDCLGDQNIW